MNFLERIPTRWLLTGAALACLVLWAGPGWAQTAGDAALGEALFNDAPNVAPDANLSHNCVNCHGTVQNRRARIGGSDFADISFDTAMSRLGAAIAANRGGPDGMGQYSRLGNDNIRHIAAYIADTPKVTATDLTTEGTLAFQSTALNNAVTKNLTLHHSVATSNNLTVTGITLSAGTTAFSRTGTCSTLAPSGSCTFSITYTPTSTAAESKTLTIGLRQGTTNFTRTITLNGSVAGGSSTPAPTTPPPLATGGGSDDTGGGALGGLWLGGLALGVAALARRRRTH